MASSSVIIAVSFLLVSFALSSWGTLIEMPPECEGQQYCETKPDNYPELDHVVKELQTKELLRVRRSGRAYGPEPRAPEPEERIFDDDYNCDTKDSVVRPYIIKTNTTVKFVVQTNEFKQMIKMAECVKEDSRCFGSLAGLMYDTSCTPTMGTIKLYLFDPSKDEKNRLEYKTVSYPVNCACSFKSNM